MTSPVPLEKPLRDLFNVFMSLGSALQASADTRVVVRLLRAACPDVVELALVEASQFLREGYWTVARRVLEDADRAHPGSAGVKAMLALVLYALEDALWQAYADECAALQPDETARHMLATIRQAQAGELVARDAAAEAAETIQAAASVAPGLLYHGIPC